MISKFSKKIKKNSDIYVIFYSDWCGYSMEAIKYLKKEKIPFKAYKIDKIKGKLDKLLTELKKDAHIHNFDINHKTRPLIFKYGIFLGGYGELINNK
jgi:glutaredoxin